MLTIVIGEEELFNEETNEFSTAGGVELHLEHSLVSLSKWEAKHQKAFLSPEPKTIDETIDYIKCMILDENVNASVIDDCSPKTVTQIQEYIQSPQSATRFGNLPEKGGSNEQVTAELIYYWLTAFTIPWEAKTWHLNQLFALIKICNIKNDPKGQKMPNQQRAQFYREENERRRRELGTSG